MKLKNIRIQPIHPLVFIIPCLAVLIILPIRIYQIQHEPTWKVKCDTKSCYMTKENAT